MTTGQLLVKFGGDTKGFFAASKQIKGETKSLGTDLKGIGSIWTAVTAGAFAVGAAKIFKAFAQQEDAVEGLRSTLRATGREAAGASDLILKSAADLQKLTRHGDEAILAATSSVGILADNLSASELAQAQKALVGLADTFFKGDLEGAAQMLGKTLGSNVNALTRYGIQIDVNASQQEKLAQVTAQTAAMFEVSKDKAKTNMGILVQAKNAWGDMLEVVGGVGVAAVTSEGSVGDLTTEIQDVTAYIEQNRQSFVGWATVAVKGAEAVIAPFRTLVRLVFNFGQNVGEGFNLLGAIFAGDWDGIDASMKRIRGNWDDMGDAIDSNKDSWTELLDALKDAAKGGLPAVAKAVERVTASVNDQVNALTKAQRLRLQVGAGVTPPKLDFGFGTPESLAKWKQAQEVIRSGQITLFNPTPSTRAPTPGFTGAEGASGGGLLSEVGGVLKGFGKSIGGVLSALNPWSLLLQAIGHALGDFLANMTPIIEVLAAALMPILKALWPVFKLLAIAATYVGQIFFTVAGGVAKAMGWLIRAIGKAIDALPFVSAKGIIKAGQNMMDLGDGFIDGAHALGEARDTIRGLEWKDAADNVSGLGDAAQEASDALRNVPQGVKLAFRRFQATQGASAMPGTTTSTATGGSVTVEHVTIQVAKDDSPTGVWDKFRRGATEAAARGDLLARGILAT